MKITNAMKASAIRRRLADNYNCEVTDIKMSETTEGWYITIPDIGRYHMLFSRYESGPHFWGPALTDNLIPPSPENEGQKNSTDYTKPTG